MNTIVLSIIAGTLGTGLGGLLTALLRIRSEKLSSIFLSFAGGVMTSVVFFELLPDAAEHVDGNVYIVILGFAIGVAVVFLLNQILDRSLSNVHFHPHPHLASAECSHEQASVAISKQLVRSGLLMFFVIGLHNIPEGIAIGAAGNHNSSLGLTLALMIGLHNLPIGMAISTPLIAGGWNKWKAVLLALAVGTSTVLGALIGVITGGVSEIALSLSFSAAGGAMLYAMFGEILPQSINMRRDRLPTIVLLIGIAVGFLVTSLIEF